MDYIAGNGDLIINGTDFRGIKSIELLTSGDVVMGAALAVDPNAPPAGVTVNATGTTITITATALNGISATWADTAYNSRKVRLTSAGAQAVISPTLNVKD